MPDLTPLPPDSQLHVLLQRSLDGSYELGRELGRGGMGIVYQARDKRLKRSVAIKLLPPELAFRGEIKSRFLREAETAAQLSHPNIVPIYSVDEREGLVFFVMACVEGDTLAKRLMDEGRLQTDDTRRILREVADALSYAHGRNVVHRDIKPDNILLDGETGRVMVTDFGIARAVQDSADSRLTATGVAIGTPAYMSPEQAAGDREIDGRSDLYSLGIVGYQMLAGELPFRASNTPTMLMKHLTERPVPLEQRRPDIPRDLAAIVMTLLEKEPAQRFPSAHALVAALSPEPGQRAYTAPASAAGPQRGDRPTSPLPGMRDHTSPYAVGYGAPRESALAYEPAGPQPAAFAADDVARWDAPQVQAFRSKFARYVAINVVLVIASIFIAHDILTFTVFYSLFMAMKYSKLWSAGYDWRDVFRQPSDRRLIDVATETVCEVRGVFDRAQGRNRPSRTLPRPRPGPVSPMAPPLAYGGAHARPNGFGSVAPVPLGGGATRPPSGAGPRAALVQQAAEDRAEIHRAVQSLPRGEQQRFADVIPVADGLLGRIQALASSLDEADRSADRVAPEQLERQIADLEAQANPLEERASDERVRRLAVLKRQRRALIDSERRRSQGIAKLDSCVLELHNMRLELLRMRTGGAPPAPRQLTQLTHLTQRARALADEMDAQVYAADEVNRVVSAPRERPRP